MKNKVLVTGGKGFIGSHLVNALKDEGFFVRSVDIKSSSYLNTEEDEFLQADLCNVKECRSAIRGMDEVYHLSADMGGIGYILSKPVAILLNNTLIDYNVISECAKQHVSKLLFASSACVYPNYKQLQPYSKGLKEQDAYPSDPDSDYGAEKLYAERMLLALSKDNRLSVRISRFHNIYGCHGTYDGGKEKAPAALCRKIALAKDNSHIKVWGDGRQTRSFLFISDCIEAILLLMKSDYQLPINIGSNQDVSISSLASIISMVAGKNIFLDYDKTAPQGVRGRNADISLAKEILKWQPKIGLKEGLRTTYNWINDMMNEV